jgi:hypothetical protein
MEPTNSPYFSKETYGITIPEPQSNPREHPFQPVLDLIEQYSKTERPRSDPWTTILACYKELKEVERQKLIDQLNLTESQKKLLGILWKTFSKALLIVIVRNVQILAFCI